MIAPAGTLPVDQLDMLAEERVRAIGDLNLTIRGPAGLAPVAGSTTEAEAGALVVLTWTTARPYRANGAGHQDAPEQRDDHPRSATCLR